MSTLGSALPAIKDKPLVTVLTPAYNRADYLDETIQSVLTQDYPNIEYIVLDDGSKDNTPQVLQRYTGRITWETQPNMGESRTVNKGWRRAQGKYVVVVNSDDPLLPGALRCSVEFMEQRPEVLVGYPNWTKIGPQGETLLQVQLPEFDYAYMFKMHHCVVGPGAIIRRTAFDLVGYRDEAFRYVADYEYWLRLGLYGPMARIPQTLATFRVHPDSASVSNTGALMAEEHIRLMRKMYELPILPPAIRAARWEAFSWAHFVACEMCGGNLWAARWHLLRSILYQPRLFYGNWSYKWAMAGPLIPERLNRALKPMWRRVLHH